MTKNLLDSMIEHAILSIERGVCPTCKGAWLDELCIDCQHINGIPLKEIVEHGWTKEEALAVAKKRAVN